ncbi:hypothetical protein [Desulforhopalus singaporensis]|uniref:Lipoprotein n=1 Tax=Desulforhopalus singaporensis TaxID=91360 RepID=A0A1H0UNY3_9BACT|nr:hypothetical protein [Desulforhopalus singaporensis]SDP67678.1 hypothetical protein SAMN05660330_03646 [Desulforhopalus singaporensis]
MRAGFWKKYVLLATVAGFVMAGCGKSLIGKSVDASLPAFCRIDGFPAQCNEMKGYGEITPSVTITKLDDRGNYLVEGYFDASHGAIGMWRNIRKSKSRFRMLFVSGDVISDCKNISVKSTDPGNKIKFSFKYHTEWPIDAVAFTYNVVVQE